MTNYWKTDRIELQMREGIAIDPDSDFRLYFDVFDKDDNYVGYVLVDKMDARVGKCEVSAEIEESYRRKGYGRDAVGKVIDYLFSYKRYHRIACELVESNLEYEPFVLGFGFAKEGVWKELKAGEDVHVYSILAEELFEGRRCEKNYAALSQGDAFSEEMDCANMNITKTTLRLAPMTRTAYSYKHEIMYDLESSLMLDGTANLPVDPEELSEWEEKHLDGNEYGTCVEYAIVDEEGDMVGTGGIDGIDEEDSKFSYHIYIFEDYAGQGYGAQALYLLLQEGFAKRKLHKMYTYIDESNIASLRIARRNGCQVEGLARDMEFYQGKYASDYMIGLTSEQFESVHKMREL